MGASQTLTLPTIGRRSPLGVRWLLPGLAEPAVRALATAPLTSARVAPRPPSSGRGSARQSKARVTSSGQGGSNRWAAQAAAAGLETTAPYSRQYRARHMLRSANAWSLRGRSQAGAGPSSCPAHKPSNSSRTAACRVCGLIGSITVLGRGPATTRPCSRAIQRSSTQVGVCRLTAKAWPLATIG